MKRGQTKVFGREALFEVSGGEQALATAHWPPQVELATPLWHPSTQNWLWQGSGGLSS
jgi:hypothetical protein